MSLGSLLVLVLTRRCDRDCGYCPQSTGDEDMSEGTLDAALDGLVPRLGPPARVKLFGGEPLLRPDLVKRALARLAALAPGTAVELPTHGGGLPAVSGLLARRPEVEVFVSRPDPLAARMPGVVHNFLLVPGEAPATAVRRLASARRLGFSRFNFLPAYFVLWTPAQLTQLAVVFQALRLVLERWSGAGCPAEVVNLTRRGTTPLYNDGLVVDTDGEIYSSNLILAGAVRPHRRRLHLGSVVDPGRLSLPAADAAQVLSDSYSPEILASTRAVDAALTQFCLSLGEVRLEARLASSQLATDEGVEHVLRTYFACNERCQFCYASLSGRPVSLPEITRTLDGIRRRSPASTRISISGGEPAMDPRLGDIVTLSRERGFYDLELQTNAVYLSKRPLVEALVERGVKTFFVSFHSFRPAVYDAVTGSRRQFPLAVKGIKNILSHPEMGKTLQVSINIVLNRLNVAELPEHVDFLHELHPRHGPELSVVFSLMNDAGHLKAPALAVSLRDIAVPLNEAIARCRRWGIGVTEFFGASAPPLCLAEDPLPHANDLPMSQAGIGVYPEDFTGDARGRRAKSAACGACRYGPKCLGVPLEYARLFGVEDLSPIVSGRVR